MPQPTFSVVVPAYNEERTLSTCLDSLGRQNCSFPYEIIVVDNASTDCTAALARQAGVRLISEPKKGVAAARRAGFAAAQANIIASTDADCIVPSDWLSRFWQVLNEKPDLVAVGGYAMYYDAPLYLDLFTHAGQRLNVMQLAGNLARRQPLTTQNLAVRKSAYEQVGGFDPNITSPLGLDDADLTMRLSSVGQVVVLPDLIVQTSARRYQQDPLRTVGYRWANYASYALRNRGAFRHKTADVRL